MSPGGQTAVDGVPAKGATHFTSFQASRSSECIRAHFCTRTKHGGHEVMSMCTFVIFRSFTGFTALPSKKMPQEMRRIVKTCSAPIGVIGISQLWASQYCPGVMEPQLDMSYLYAHDEARRLATHLPTTSSLASTVQRTWNTINTF